VRIKPDQWVSVRSTRGEKSLHHREHRIEDPEDECHDKDNTMEDMRLRIQIATKVNGGGEGDTYCLR
jgi:hypothetical protein